MTFKLLILTCLAFGGVLSACAPSQLRDLACENIIDTDLERAYTNPAYEDRNIFWTIHMNFKAFVPRDQRRPLGCFRLYARNISSKRYEAIDNGGQIIYGCKTVNGAVRFGTRTVLHTSHGESAVDAGEATFDGNGYLDCQLSIKDLTHAAVNSALALRGHRDLKALLLDLGFDPTESNFTSILKEYELLAETLNYHAYRTLTIVAAGVVPTTMSDPNPIIHYEPLEAEGEPVFPISMALPSLRDEKGEFFSEMNGMEYRSNSLDQNECWFNSQEHYWWTDFDSVAAAQHDGITLTYAKRQMGQPISPPCTRIVPRPSLRSVNFWTGPAKLYIGCKPDRNQGCMSRLKGTLFGIVIDPPNSKPQFGGD